MTLSAKNRRESTAATALILTLVSATAWTEELSVRKAIHEASNLSTSSIAKRLNHLVRQGALRRRREGPFVELRRIARIRDVHDNPIPEAAR